MLQNILKLSADTSNITKISGVSKDSQSLIALSRAIIANKNVLIIATNEAEARNIHNLATAFKDDFDNTEIWHFPNLIGSPYQKISANKSVFLERINTLNGIKNTTKRHLVITNVKAYLERIIPKQVLEGRSFLIKVESILNVDNLIEYLIKNNYQRMSLVAEEGQFSQRGDIIDIYCGQGAFRIDLMGDIVERIRIFDPTTQITVDTTNEINLQSSSEVVLEDEFLDNFKETYKNIFNTENKDLFELLNNKIVPKGIENYLPLFYKKTENVLNHLGDNTLIIALNGVNDGLLEVKENFDSEYKYGQDLENIFKTKDSLLPPNKLIFELEEIKELEKKYNLCNLNSFKLNHKDDNLDLNIKDVATEFAQYKSKASSPIEALFSFVKENPRYSFEVFCYSEPFYETLNNRIEKEKIKNLAIYQDISIDCGFILDDFCYLSESQITGIKKTFGVKKSSNKKILEHLSTFNKGDIVVHIKHGFGEYAGITTLKVNGGDHDFVEIIYHNNEKLYVPVENIETLSRYGSANEEVGLDKLGSSSFERRQEKIKEKIKDIAYDLIKVAAQRKTKRSPSFDYNVESFEAFCKDFPYIETEDQLKAINDIIADFMSGVPSDRLICGDVGFGKTEVAMRAAFLIANSGHSVALIAPTTLLCRQHYNNFVERFKNFPFKIAQLSRFVSTKEKKQIKQDLAEGKIDIIIGTHSLLSDNIKINNLGLIIIDEEQNFGVLHKEKLKAMKEDAHLITMSATPIPRTIQLAFKGVKDLSLITTPPVEKLPINTHVLPYDYATIKGAIHKEIIRGGQVYFVCPRIADLLELKQTLERLELNSYVVIHGQMPTNEIEESMIAFQNKEYNILVSTNIIESGLDLPNVNTIIIQKSDIFGLAQLYQLRGRVGRGNKQSYAYLLYDKNKPLNENAEKRLQILQNLDYLGASFALASYDLDIRGAGNLLGEEQSGHVKEIGFDLYQKLLEQEIYNLKNDKDVGDLSFSPVINLGIPVLIPKKYIHDMETSIEIYQRMGRIKDYNEIVELKYELIDRFGRLPEAVENLLLSLELKLLCKKALVEKVIFGEKGVALYFYLQKFPKVEELIAYVNKSAGTISIKPQGYIVLLGINMSVYDQVKKVKVLLEDLIKIIG
jgi:transcription-repair coupling factor (superfamily II helicase)